MGTIRARWACFAAPVKQQSAELRPFLLVAVEYRALPSSGWQSYNRVTESPTTADQTGVRDGRTIPWHTAIREAAGSPAGFLEGNRGTPPPRRDHCPALGKTGRNARSSSPA